MLLRVTFAVLDSCYTIRKTALQFETMLQAIIVIINIKSSRQRYN